MRTYKIFLASSEELKDDREKFELQINRKNKIWVAQGVFLELVVWEDFLDALSPTRLQDKYNEEISRCDVFVMLFWTKVGKYTEEEFEHAVSRFKATDKPFVYTYFKDAPSAAGNTVDDSVQRFKQKLAAMGHFFTRYDNVEGLQLHFIGQLDKLVANGFIAFPPRDDDGARGDGAMQVGPGAVVIRGNNSGNINTGMQITTHTDGGAYITGHVNTGGGDFTGRDRIGSGTPPKATVSKRKKPDQPG